MGLVSYGMMWGSWSGGGLVARPGLNDTGSDVTTLGGDAAASIGGGSLLCMGMCVPVPPMELMHC